MARKIADTKKMTHEEWVELRKSSIGGSDAATCVGMNPYSSLISLYAEKKGLSKERDDNEAMRLGRDLEAYVAERFCNPDPEHGETWEKKKVRNDNFMYADDYYGFITANLDRRIVGENAGLECKTMKEYAYDLASKKIPEHYYCQCQHYMMVMGFDKMYLAILVYHVGMFVIDVERNDDFILQLREAEVDFWTNYIEKDHFPEPDGSDAAKATLNGLYPEAVKGTEILIPDLDRLIMDYKDASEWEKEAKERKASIQAQICAKLGDNEVGIGVGYSCSWKNQSKESIDTKRLKAEMPDVYAKYAKVSDYRVFRTKKIKK